MNENCKETYLEGVVDAYIYAANSVKIPVPFNVAQQQTVSGCTFGTPVLHIATSGEDDMIADSISAKVTSNIDGNGAVYTHEITVSVTQNPDLVRQAHKNLNGLYCHVVLQTSDGSRYICYACPGTFLFNPTFTMSDSSVSVSSIISLKSMSNAIKIISE